MDKKPIETLDQKLRAFGFPDPDPGLRRQTLDATERIVRARSGALDIYLGTRSWWLEGLLVSTVVLLALGGALAQELGWSPVDPRLSEGAETTDHYRQLQNSLGDLPLGFASHGPRAAQDPQAPRESDIGDRTRNL